MASNYTPTPQKLYFCVECDSVYGTCEHGHNYLPKDEHGIVLTVAEFQVLHDAGDID